MHNCIICLYFGHELFLDDYQVIQASIFKICSNREGNKIWRYMSVVHTQVCVVFYLTYRKKNQHKLVVINFFESKHYKQKSKNGYET